MQVSNYHMSGKTKDKMERVFRMYQEDDEDAGCLFYDGRSVKRPKRGTMGALRYV